MQLIYINLACNKRIVSANLRKAVLSQDPFMLSTVKIAENINY